MTGEAAEVDGDSASAEAAVSGDHRHRLFTTHVDYDARAFDLMLAV